MITRLHSATFIILLGLAACAAGKDSTVQIRAVLQDSAKPDAQFFVGKAGAPRDPLKLADEGLTEPQKVTIENGNLHLFTSATIDKGNPLAGLAATTKVPAGASRLIVIIVPAAPGKTPPYRMEVLDDDPKSFPWGESRAVNLTPVEFSLEVGDQKVPLPAGKVTAVPKVTKVDEYNRAQTNFFSKQKDEWVITAELQMQYVDSLRRVFVIYEKTPEAKELEVRTLVDQKPVGKVKAR